MAKKRKTDAKTLFVYPDSDSEAPLFKVQELKDKRILVTYDPKGDLFHFEGTGNDLGYALDNLLESLNRLGQRAYGMYHQKIFDEFLSELALKNFRI